MVCNLLMKPILLAAGILAIVASIALFVVAREPELPPHRRLPHEPAAACLEEHLRQ